jgi:hypothetical protein
LPGIKSLATLLSSNLLSIEIGSIYRIIYYNWYKRGWRPVKVSDDPDRIPSDLLELDEVAKVYICEGDCILLKREIKRGEMERKKHNEYSLKMATESKAYNFNDKKPTENALDIKI